MNSTQYNIRSIAAKTLNEVLEKGTSLSSILPLMQQQVSPKDKGLLQEICYGVIRSLPELDWFADQLMDKPLDRKQKTIHYLILVGFYQLHNMRIPAHAAICETVNAVSVLKRPQLKGLINGVLRQFQRQESLLVSRLENLEVRHWHPEWLLKKVQKSYPKEWLKIIEANNQKPPMWLRVNPSYATGCSYEDELKNNDIISHAHPYFTSAVRLETPVSVDKLIGFEQGAVTVQDIHAQYAAHLISPQEGELILDLCAAPGGKTTHLLEIAPKAKVVAVEIDETRALRIKENLKRLHKNAEVIIADGTTPEKWANGRQFDKILLDAPCSATGVIRRHPDIKWLRRSTDIPELVSLQYQLLNAIWPYLKEGGVLVYATCSVLPEENSQQIEAFLKKHPSAKLKTIVAPDDFNVTDTTAGLQLLPNLEGGDGFYYAVIEK